EKIYNSLITIFKDISRKVLFIDLGCGPMTSGLALSDLHKNKTGSNLDINYIGIDISEAMLNKDERFLNHGVFSQESKHMFTTHWNLITDETLSEFVGLNNHIVINASYLFASISLKEYKLANF